MKKIKELLKEFVFYASCIVLAFIVIMSVFCLLFLPLEFAYKTDNLFFIPIWCLIDVVLAIMFVVRSEKFFVYVDNIFSEKYNKYIEGDKNERKNTQ